MYVFGGKDGSIGLQDIQEYRFGSRCWSEVQTVGPVPQRRWAHLAVVYEHKMWILGGCDSVINYNHLFEFDFGT
jgi:hypothetical protein